MSDSDEIDRLRARVAKLKAKNERLKYDNEMLETSVADLSFNLHSYKQRALELHAANAILRGTLSRYDTIEDDQPVIIHDVPGNAPR
jgi:predicted RNase H-like nuclease (RuvC/YqgF family)